MLAVPKLPPIADPVVVDCPASIVPEDTWLNPLAPFVLLPAISEAPTAQLNPDVGRVPYASTMNGGDNVKEDVVTELAAVDVPPLIVIPLFTVTVTPEPAVSPLGKLVPAKFQ